MKIHLGVRSNFGQKHVGLLRFWSEIQKGAELRNENAEGEEVDQLS